MKASPTPTTIDEYIATCPPAVRPILKKIRATVRKAAPQAAEKLSYRMPAFFQDGVLIYFAAFNHHIGLYPPVRGDEKLMAAASPYRGPKGNLQLPLDKPIPYGLIGRIVKARLKERQSRKAAGSSRKSAKRS
jgi:uncharacterized protein YdhG (YjbR/CyaY superfamily)